MLNIVIPMAGRGSRFVSAGYQLPKPLIEVHENPMIAVVVDNLRPQQACKFIFICLEEHNEKYQIEMKLKSLVPDSEVILIDGVTEGAACTVLKAKSLINNDDPLMIANSDQWIDFNINDYLLHMQKVEADGMIMTMKDRDPKWSFAAIKDGWVVEVAEKRVISDEATVGIYNFKKGSDFVRAAEKMIKKNIRTNNEFYVAPTYNQLISEGARIAIFNIGTVSEGMHGLGIPEDLRSFLGNPKSERYKRIINADEK